MSAEGVRAGVAYRKSGSAYDRSGWGVPVTTDRRFDVGLFGALRSGAKFLVVVPLPFRSLPMASPEAAVEALATVPEAMRGFRPAVFARECLHERGLDLALWTLDDFEGPLVEVEAARARVDAFQREQERARTEWREDLQGRWDAVTARLDLPDMHLFATGGTEIDPDRCIQMLHRLEAIAAAAPLLDGSL